MGAPSKQDVFIVEPRLCRADGHEFEHAIAFAEAIKANNADHTVVILSAPQDHTLTEILGSQKTIDKVNSCFPQRWLGDWMSGRTLLKDSVRDALALWRALRQFGMNRPILFFDSLDFYRLMMLATLRCLSPCRPIKAMGIMRYDPLDGNGNLKSKYEFLRSSPAGRLLVRLALKDTLVSTDSELLQDALSTKLRIYSDIAPIPLVGIWKMPDQEIQAKQTGTTTIAFIGQPRDNRGFDLFVLTALAMEKERMNGSVKFLVITAPGGLEAWKMSRYRFIFEHGLFGLALEECWMNSVEFVRQMNRADIVWALSDPPDFYLRQTSGIFTHGFCLGKRMIANRGGWAEKTVGSLSVCRYVNLRLEETVAAVRSLMPIQPDAESLEQARQWRDRHSRRAFDEFVGQVLFRLGIGATSVNKIESG